MAFVLQYQKEKDLCTLKYEVQHLLQLEMGVTGWCVKYKSEECDVKTTASV